jgi:hypothetical protein
MATSKNEREENPPTQIQIQSQGPKQPLTNCVNSFSNCMIYKKILAQIQKIYKIIKKKHPNSFGLKKGKKNENFFPQKIKNKWNHCL